VFAFYFLAVALNFVAIAGNEFFISKRNCSRLLNYSYIHSRYFYSTSSSPLLLRGASDYSTYTASELTCRSATGNCE